MGSKKFLRVIIVFTCIICMLILQLNKNVDTFASDNDEVISEYVTTQSDDSIIDSEGNNDIEPSTPADIDSIEYENNVLGANLLRSATSTNLSDFLINLTIDAPQDDSGNYIINPNSSYEMTMGFGENESLQFDDENILTYNFPAGVLINDIGSTTFSLTITDENGSAVVYDNSFEVVDGQLRVHFNQDDPNYERLKAVPNVSFDITLSSSFDQTEGEIVFNENIIKDFVFEEVSDLTISKTVVYDIDSDTAYYELKIISDGSNENVLIEDLLSGTALIFNKDVVVESSINGNIDVTPDYTSVENGFRVTIPQTSNGEVLTLRYSATVDNTKITANGTVDQTKNTARVTSDQVPDGKEASADFAGQARFHRITKSAVGDPVQLGDDSYEQTWTIFVNQDHKVEVGGTYIYDWIVQNSRPFMLFSGDGLNINVTFENGGTETRSVPWSDLTLWQNNDGIYGWGYMTPESDGKASYEITCTTLINSSGALGNLTLDNGAQIYGSYDEASVTIEQIGESTFNIQKDAVGTTSTESEWKITVTVPGSGLSEFHVVDDGPKLVYNEQTYIDYSLEDSFEVDGLLEGESWRVRIGSDGRSFTVTFYTSETQNDSTKGVLPTADGQPRDIVIRFKTAVNQEWLDLAAADGYTSSTLYRHKNYACAWSGTYRTETVDAYVIPIKPNFVKNVIERTEVEIEGVTYPVFNYSLSLLGPLQDNIIIHDSFNTEYLKFYETPGVKILGGNSSTPTDSNGTATAVNTTEGIDITVSNFPKQTDGSFYAYYLISYSLIVKDNDALNALNAAAAASQSGIDLDNTATWEDLVSSKTVNYTYFPYVDKELLTRPTTENGYVAEFEIVINKYAEDLDPASDVLTIQDVLSSNLRFIPDSLTITPANDSITVQHDDSTNILTFMDVPDETTFVITYQARVLGSGNVTYSNTIKFGIFEKSIEETTIVDHSGGGTGSNPSITLVKRDSESLSTTLAGATFQLLYLDNGELLPVKDKDGKDVTFTTGEDGRVLIVGNLQTLGWSLWAGRTYVLEEIIAPTGYELNTEPISFILTDSPSSQIEFDITGDQININNELIKISIPVSKEWIGPVADSATIQLFADDVLIDEVILKDENNWQYLFSDLPKYDRNDGHEIAYDLIEVQIPDYLSQRSGSVEDGFVFTNIITGVVSVSVSKTWNDADNQDGLRPSSVTVKLLADEVDTGVTLELNADNNWTGTFTDLDKYQNGQKISYSVEEVDITGYSSVTTGDAETGYTITNTHEPETIEINGSKTWDDNDDQDGARPGEITIRLLAGGTEIDRVTVTDAEDWSWSFENLPKYENEGTEVVYSITEDAVSGYTPQYNGYDVTNQHTPGKTSVTVTKAWNDADNQDGIRPSSVTVKLLADEVDTGVTLKLNSDNNWTGTFTDLDEYMDSRKIVYTIEELDVTGYSSTISGDPEKGFTIINTHEPEIIDVSVLKIWDDCDDMDKLRPKNVKIRLIADGKDTGKYLILDNDNKWKGSFTDLDSYINGKRITYTVFEESVPDYSATITGDSDKGYVITNKHLPKINNSTSDHPNTGDKNNIPAYLIMIVFSLISFIAIWVNRKKLLR